MSIASDHAQLQRQLYLLGYSQTLPADGVVLVSTLLKDLQASLDRVKELEANSTRLEREERTTRLGYDKVKAELHALRTDNNSLRVEVLNHAREADRLRRETRGEQYRLGKVADDLRMANLQLKAENAERLRALGECQKRAEARLAELDPRAKKIIPPPRMSSNKPIPPSSALSATLPSLANVQKPAIVDLVDLSSRRIAALEHEIDHLEGKLATSADELKAAQMDVRERDLEILRLHSEYDRINSRQYDHQGGGGGGDDSAASDVVPRLADQVEYLHERAEALEREKEALGREKEALERENEELHKRWRAAENERTTTANKSTPPPPTTNSSPAGTGSPSSPDAIDRLRTECSNIKSLYAQTRDQLQELLRSGNAEQRLAIERARQAEESSQSAVRDLRQQLAAMPEYRELSESRAKQVAALEEKLRTAEAQYSAELARLRDQLALTSESLQKTEHSVGERQSQHQALMSEYQTLVEQHRKLDNALKQAVDEVAEWRAKADDREHRVSDLARRADEYKLLYRQSSSELSVCKKTLDAFTQDLNTLRDSHANDQREVERLGGELEQALRMRQAVEMSKDEYKAGLAKALAENEAHRGLVAHLQAERSALRVQVKAQFHLSQRLEQRLESLDNSNHQATTTGGGDVTLAHPLPLSRSSSAAHSSRSFQ